MVQAIIANMAHVAPERTPDLSPQELDEAWSVLLWTMFRIQLLMTLGAYLLAWLVLSSKRSREFLDQADAEAAQREDTGDS
jgi:hypothetical protein